VFLFAVLAMGVIPALTFADRQGNLGTLGNLFLVVYVLLATVIVVANTAPDLVLHERVGHTLDYLLTTRLSERAIFGAKVATAFLVGYTGAFLAMAVQLVAAALLSGNGLHWLYLGQVSGRIIALGITAGLSLYVAVVGTFVALRVGEQRAAYMVTLLSVGLLVVPFLVGWLHLSLTTAWFGEAAKWLAVIALALAFIGMRVFRRDMLVLYLQE
jgi:MFS family permease